MKPKNAEKKPMIEANRNGKIEKEVRPSKAKLNKPKILYFFLPLYLASLSYSISFCLKPTQTNNPLI